MLSDLYLRLRSLFRRTKVDAELDEELRFHTEHQVEKYVLSGMSREEARRQRGRLFGDGREWRRRPAGEGHEPGECLFGNAHSPPPAGISGADGLARASRAAFSTRSALPPQIFLRSSSR